ncbi:response regulator [Flaviaesturariibacter terrae]
MAEKEIYILMVDDDEEDRYMLEQTFGELDFAAHLHSVADGESALSWLRQSRELPSLIILDLNMPRMNGRQTLAAIKSDERLRSLCVVIFSTSLNPIERDECLALGAHSYEVKPATYRESLQTGRRFCDLCVTIRDAQATA